MSIDDVIDKFYAPPAKVGNLNLEGMIKEKGLASRKKRTA